MEEIDIPQYFICPISLQIMRDPVTAVSGITYDRDRIEHWLSTTTNATCPVTKQPLPTDDSELTPNHTLRRLIQAWCVANAKNGVDQIPTPKSPLNKSHVFKLIRELRDPLVRDKVLNEMERLAKEKEKNKACLVEAGAIKAIFLLLITCFREEKTSGVEEALGILCLIWSPKSVDVKQLVKENGHDLVESFLWVLRLNFGTDTNKTISVKTQAVLALKLIIEVVSSNILDRLRLDFHQEIVKLLDIGMSQQVIKAAFQILNEVCPWGRNRTKIIESQPVFRLVELEINNPEKNITELIFCLLAHLCSCADGRAQLIKHGGGIAMVAKRILRVSLTTDDRAIHILALISRFLATREVVMEMLRVGAVSKLCMVLQADTAKYMKDKAREVLRLHSKVWNDSPCIAVYLLTKDPRFGIFS